MLRWLRSRLFFPLLVMSLTAMAFYGLWPTLIGAWNGPRLHLNLFLAWVPYLLALVAVTLHQQLPERPWLFRFVAVWWLLFFPNAPYLITDWLYLTHWQNQLWYSIILLTSFTLCGMLLAVTSLHLMQTVVAIRSGPDAGRAVAVIAIVLCGVGVYLGRFVRLNSWNLLTHPGTVFRDTLAAMESHPNHAGVFGFSILFAVLIGSTYYGIVELRRTDRSREEQLVWRRERE